MRELVTNVVLIFLEPAAALLYSQGKMRGAGDSFGDELEERARKRLELEEVRQKRVALELQLGARRKDAEAAQRGLRSCLAGLWPVPRQRRSRVSRATAKRTR